ncbi:MAG TPA: ATP-binding protein [Rubrobacter sp.]|nr:ATP-binding protein [Rubrobacter sp.]
MTGFVGRERYLRVLNEQLEQVLRSGEGRFVSMRGRRRVGKSRLVEEFLRRQEVSVPYVFFTASRQPSERELSLFAEEVAGSDMPAADVVRGGLLFESWDAALALIASTADRSSPAVVVMDEFPYLVEADSAIEGTLQKVWDRRLSKVPILLILVGSDVSMMTALTEYGRPLYGRPTREMVVEPFDPSETADMLGLSAADAFDAQLVTGGFPLIAQSWGRGNDLWGFLSEALSDPTSPLIVSGERVLAAEFPVEAQARNVLWAIGTGETTFTAISRLAGISGTPLARSLELLVERKRVVSADRPLSAKPSRETRYHVADPYLRFWLRFVGPGIEEAERGRGELVVEGIRRSWTDYRGKAVEPLVREAVERLLPDERFGAARYVGGYWTRKGEVEVDLVGAEREAGPRRVEFVGSIKWRERTPFGRRDLARLVSQAPRVPGTDTETLTVGVSRSGFDAKNLDVKLNPEALLDAWRSSSN